MSAAICAAVVFVSFSSPALAQSVCTLEPPIGERPIARAVYVPDRFANTISIVDVTPGSLCRNQVIGVFSTGGNSTPTAVVATPDGKKAYVLNSQHDAVGVIDTRLSKVLFEIPVGGPSGGLAMAINPAGTRVYVANLFRGDVAVIDTTTDTRIANIPLAEPGYVPPSLGIPLAPDQTFPVGLNVTPDGTELWATVQFPGGVTIIDTATNTVKRYIHLAVVNPGDLFPPAAIDVAFSGTGGAAVANIITLGRVNVDIGAGIPVTVPDVLYRIPVSDTSGAPPAPVLVGTGASGNGFGTGAAEVVIDNAGNTWVSNAGDLDPIFPVGPDYSHHVTVITPGGAPSIRDTLGNSPVGLGRSTDRSEIYVVNFTSDTVSIFTAGSAAPPTVVSVGDGPVTPFGFTIPAFPDPPAFAAPCGQTLTVLYGTPVAFNLAASTTASPAWDDLTLVVTGLPAGASMTPSLPRTGSGLVSSSFAWTPTAAALGFHIVTFTATDVFAQVSPCQVTVQVTQPSPPVFLSPPVGESYSVVTGEELGFTVEAVADTGAGSVVLDLLSGSSLPGSATMMPPLPTGGSSTATSSFSWTPTAGDEGTHTVTFTATDGLGQQALNTITIGVIEPADEVPFSIFLITKLHLDTRPRKGKFDLRGAFRLGHASNGVDPETEDVIIGFDDHMLTIPAGSFREHGRNNFKFTGTVDGVKINAELKGWRGFLGRTKWWTFAFVGKDADLSDVDNRVDVKVQVGDDVGIKKRWAWIKY